MLPNQVIVMTMLLGRMTKKIFLGSLRDAEVEAVYENARFAITETCLALTIFRDEITMRVGGLFLALLFAKTFHWLAQSRMEYIEQSEIVTRLVHIRLVVLIGFMFAMDSSFVALAVHTFMADGPNVTFLFGFEFLILSINIVSIFGKYLLYLVNLRSEGTWSSKSGYQFCLELLADVVTLCVYIAFFMIILTHYGMPLHILRELWMSLKNLQRRITTYVNYRRLTANLNDRFPDVTEEQLAAMGPSNRTCIICREDMNPAAGERIKKIPCGHIFHFRCLQTWLQQQQNCPTCRAGLSLLPHSPPLSFIGLIPPCGPCA
jgi:E3 ubiquitin-protein ligase synoviolin